MNNRQLKKSLELFSNGHKFKDVAQLANCDERDLNRKFKELQVTDEYSALSALRDIEREEANNPKDPTGGRSEKGGQVEPPIKVIKDPQYKHQGNFDRNKIIQNYLDEDIVPLAEQHRFRKELYEFTWDTFKGKWMEFLNISEKTLKEQVKKIAPGKYKEVFAGEEE